MDEVYKLIFRGEVLKGQHVSVVKIRLTKTLKLDKVQAEKLFSGAAVVIKRAADTSTAARFQALFKEAGARLRVMPVEGEDSPASKPDPVSAGSFETAEGSFETAEGSLKTAEGSFNKAAEGSHSTAEGSKAADKESAFDLLPAGSEVLTAAERQTNVAPMVNSDQMSLAAVGSNLSDGSELEFEAGSVIVPNISYLSLADLGVDLHQVDEADDAHSVADTLMPVVEFEIAEVGSYVLPLTTRQIEPEAVIDLTGYDLAELGADIGEAVERVLPPAPDTSHLHLYIN